LTFPNTRITLGQTSSLREAEFIMLKNERQYRIAKAEAKQLEVTLIDLAHENGPDDLGGDKGQTHRRQERERHLRASLSSVRRDLEEYEALRAGRGGHRIFRRLETLEELPRSLIQARIVAGFTHKELAERLGLKEQQVQHYEATEYASASLSRVREIAKILGSGR
jgi:DNA-directed RNA polymerase specialized sigma24 family protein